MNMAIASSPAVMAAEESQSSRPWRASDDHSGVHLDRFTALQFSIGVLGGYLRLPWWLALAAAVSWEALEYEMRRSSPGSLHQVSRMNAGMDAVSLSAGYWAGHQIKKK